MPAGTEARLSDFARLGAWAGMVFGLAEGALLLLLYEYGSDPMWRNGVGPRSLWVNPLTNAVLFPWLALVAAGAMRRVKKLDEAARWAICVALLAAVSMLGLLLSPRTIQVYGCVAAALGALVQAYRMARRGKFPAVFFRRTLPRVAAIVIVAGIGAEAWTAWKEHRALEALAPARPGAPNVLIIIGDALRADHMSAYGYARQTTPAMDRMAREGVLFERAFSAGHWSVPGHVGILAGTIEHEGWLPPWRVKLEYPPLLSETLSQHGYATMIASSNSMWFTPKAGFAPGVARFDVYYHNWRDAAGRSYFAKMLLTAFRLGVYYDNPIRMRAVDVNRRLLEWVDESRERQRPFFATLNYTEPHDPYWPPEPFTRKFNPALTRLRMVRMIEGSHPRKGAHAEAAREMMTDAYDSCVAYLDHYVGLLLAELERRRVLSNTLVILTADHGEALGPENRYGHTQPHVTPDVTRVPLIVRYPPGVPAGLRVAGNVSSAQIPATIAQLLGLPADIYTRLPSLLAATNGGGEPVLINGRTRHAVASGNWFFAYEGDTKIERLYNLEDDPAGQRNLAGRAEYAQILAAMRQELEAQMARHNVPRRTSAEVLPTN